jgi:NAD(P)H-dependent flavin oxidoreductase YrpB (nitropropane dioxygenase family)
MPLLAQAAEVVRVPLVAAGGLASARDLAAVLAAGASAARLGTRFVASRESDAHPAYVAALLAAHAEDTQLTEAFGEGWPHAPHRVLRSAIAAAEALPTARAGELRVGAERIPLARFSTLPPTRETSGEIAAMALYAGESVENIASVEGACELVAALCDGAERLLGESAPR